jgi:class 3 adenylate cyclase
VNAETARMHPLDLRQLLYILLLGPLWFSVAMAAPGATAIDPAADHVDLSASTYLLEDPEGKLRLAEVRSAANADRFQRGSPKIGYTTSAYWMRFVLTSAAPQSATRWLDSGNRTLYSIAFFAPDESGVYRRQTASSARPFSERPLATANFVFPLELPPDRPVTVYLRVRDIGASGIHVTPKIWQPGAYQKAETDKKMLWTYYLGMAFALGLFNLLLYFYIRDVKYFLYVILLVSTAWLVSSGAGGSGFSFEYLWPGFPDFEQKAWGLSVLAAVYSSILFVTRFLDIRHHLPRLYVSLNASVLLYVVLLGLLITGALPMPDYAWLVQKLSQASAVLLILIGIQSSYGQLALALSGDRLAIQLCVAFAPLGLVGFYGSLAGALGKHFDPEMMMWASAFEFIVMSMSLAYRFNQEIKAKMQAQAELVEGLQRSECELEAKVEQRTAEVRTQSAQLDEWNHKLEQRVQEQVNQIDRLGRLKRFFSPQLAEAIVAEKEEALKTHRREISVVFIDLRGFTAFTDRAEPEEVIEMLHAFHGMMGRIIMEHGGTLERFAGDSIMIFFNDPVPIANHAEKAVRMALAMQEAFRTLSAEWRKRGYELGLGCGIALGYATLGEIGFEGRWDYAAIGSVTNLAARLCAEAGSGEVFADRKVMGKVESLVQATSVGPLALKGFSQSVPAFSLTELDSAI